VPTLADLISARKSDRGWSYQQLAGRANDVVSRQRWQQLGTGVRIKEFPEPTTIQAIADALEVDVTLVVLSVARSIGFEVRTQDSSLAAMLPPGADELNEEQRDAVLAVVRAMAPRRTAGVTNDTNEEPRQEEGGQEQRGTGRKTRNPGAPMKPTEDVQAEDLTMDHQGVSPDNTGKQDDYALARRVGETEERRRRRVEGEPWDRADPEGPETGA
jgi:hypothetical protein